MGVQWSRARLALFVLAMVLVTPFIMVDQVITPIINNIYEAFPDEQSMVNLFVAAPSAVAIFCFLVPPLIKRFGKRRLMVFATALFAVFTIFGVAIEDITYMVVCRLFVGVAFGMINVLYVSIIADVYVDENKRAKFMGVYMFCQAAMGSIFSQVSGLLGSVDWTHSFWIYVIAVPAVILCALFLPRESDLVRKDEPSTDNAQPLQEPDTDKGRFGVQFVTFVIIMLLVAIVFYMFFSFSSVYVATNGLGDEVFNGTVAMVNTICSALANLVVGFVFVKLRGKTGAVLLAVYTLGFLVLGLFPTRAGALIGSGLVGAGYGTFFTFLLSYIPEMVPAKRMDLAISLITMMCFIGTALAPYLVTFLAGTMSGSVNPIYWGSGICMAAMVVVTFAASVKRKSSERVEQGR